MGTRPARRAMVLLGALGMLAGCGTLFDVDGVDYQGQSQDDPDTGDARDGEDLDGDNDERDAPDSGDEQPDADPDDASDADDPDAAPSAVTCPDDGAPCAIALGHSSAISDHNCVKLATGKTACWGDNRLGQLGNASRVPLSARPLQAELEQVSGLGTGAHFTCALVDGVVMCAGDGGVGQFGAFGFNPEVQFQAVEGLPRVTEIALGGDHGCALDEERSVWCWGNGDYGELGPDQNAEGPSPRQVPLDGEVHKLVVGGNVSCAIVGEERRLMCWGSNEFNLLAQPTALAPGTCVNAPCFPTPSPVTFDGAEPVNEVLDAAVGRSHACLVQPGGQVFCWGDNSSRQLAQPELGIYEYPTRVPAVEGIEQVAVGEAHTCALDTNYQDTDDVRSRVVCWGLNDLGQSGSDQRTLYIETPVEVRSLTNAVKLTAGGNHTCARTDSQVVTCWGDNFLGQTGQELPTTSTPQIVPDVAAVLVVSAGRRHTCAVDGQRRVHCWGSNEYGQLGSGGKAASASPLVINTSMIMSSVALGDDHSCGRGQNERVWCWGRNDVGQLGSEVRVATSTPTEVEESRFTPAGPMALGRNHTCVLSTDHKVWCWGFNGLGQLGAGDDMPHNKPVEASGLEATELHAGPFHTCALDLEGRVLCWGSNAEEQLGPTAGPCEEPDPTCLRRCALENTDCVQAPRRVEGIEGATSLAVGRAHGCAQDGDGEVRCWGVGRDGQRGDVSNGQLDGINTVAGLPEGRLKLVAGSAHTCALDDEGRVWCWGANGEGQLGVGNNNNAECDAGACILIPQLVARLNGPAVDITAGSLHTCALMPEGSVRCWGAGYAGQTGQPTFSGSNVPVEVELGP